MKSFYDTRNCISKTALKVKTGPSKVLVCYGCQYLEILANGSKIHAKCTCEESQSESFYEGSWESMSWIKTPLWCPFIGKVEYSL